MGESGAAFDHGVKNKKKAPSQTRTPFLSQNGEFLKKKIYEIFRPPGIISYMSSF